MASVALPRSRPAAHRPSAAGDEFPPGPASPPAAQFLRWIVEPGRYLRASRARYGDVFTLRLSIGDTVVVADPQLVKRIFTAPPEVLRAGEANMILEPVVGRGSLLVLDRDVHLRERRLLLPPFHGRRIERYAQLIAEEADREIGTWPIGEPFAIHPRMQAVTLAVILRAVFGLDAADAHGAIGTLVARFMTSATSLVQLLRQLLRARGDEPPAPDPDSQVTRDLIALDEALYAEIARRRHADDLGDRDDILSLLLAARYEDGSAMSDAHVRDELVTMLIAGHETTATALAWAFERLVRHPAAMERLRDEAAAGDGGEYAAAIGTETLRVRPPVWIVARRVARTFELGGHEIPPDAVLAPCPYLVNMREDLYPRATSFEPERHLGRAPDTYAWIPFGGGRRRCLGAAFAQLELRTVLTAVARRCELEAADPAPERPARRAVVFAPNRGGRVVVRARVG